MDSHGKVPSPAVVDQSECLSPSEGFVFGKIGCGKRSGSGAVFTEKLLHSSYGRVIMVVKEDDNTDLNEE